MADAQAAAPTPEARAQEAQTGVQKAEERALQSEKSLNKKRSLEVLKLIGNHGQRGATTRSKQ